jgi:hypothetical protein
MKINIGGETVDLLDDEICCVLRNRDGVNEDWLLERNFTFHTLADGGGKGGSLMQKTADERLLVKSLSSEDSLGMKLILPAYASHLSSNPNSLLARFYYHFRRGNGTVCPLSLPGNHPARFTFALPQQAFRAMPPTRRATGVLRYELVHAQGQPAREAGPQGHRG